MLTNRIYFALYWGALAFFVGFALQSWTGYFRSAAPTFSPDSGLDAVALHQLGLRTGAESLRKEIAAYPEDTSMIVFGPGNEIGLTDSYYLISYLAWPRPVWCRGLAPAGQQPRFTGPTPPPGVRPKVMFFYRMPPPAQANARQIAPGLAIGAFPQ